MNERQEVRFQGEIWELQVWVMWILALCLNETGHNILFWIVLVWSIISFLGAFYKARKAKKLEREAPTQNN